MPARVRRGARWHWQLAAVGACVLAAVLMVSAVAPTPAQAWILGLPSPGQVISGLLGGIGSVIGGTVGKLAVTAFDAIIHALFAPIAHFINTQLIGWLVAVPDYAPAGSHVAATEHTVLAMAGAALGAVATISIARFWVAGPGGQRRLGARGARAHGRRGVAAADLAVDVPHRGRARERREHRAARIRERDEVEREPAGGRRRRRAWGSGSSAWGCLSAS